MFRAFNKDPRPRSHYDIVQHYYAQYDKQISTGEYQPFLYPWGLLGAVMVITYLLIPHQNQPWLKKCRYLAFAWIVAIASYSVRYTRAKGMAASLGIGLISAWSVVWICAILVCNDAQTDFQRIERLEGAFKGSESTNKKEMDNTVQGSVISPREEKGQFSMTTGHAGPRDRHGSFAWQPYPLTPFIERLDWVCDIFCNFRGAGWDWRTSALPPPPKYIQEQLHRNSGGNEPNTSCRVHNGQVKLYATQADLLRANTKTLLIGYLALDALKTIMMHDPYFWGLVNHPPPTYFPFSHLTSRPILTHATHLILSMLGVKHALQTTFALGPLFFCGLLGPSLLGARAEPWMYPETWAPYSVVLDKGLAGWWGSWWHQTFRFAFQEPSRKAIEVLGLDRKSALAKAGQLVTAFGLSGIVHASGSYTCAGQTRPFRGPIVFFLLQAAGIFAEVLGAQVLKGSSVKRRVPPYLKRAFTFLYVHVWFYYTAHLLCDDFSRGGIWLFEPIPVSLFRGIGFGADERDGWWCWGNMGEVLRWHKGETWWTSGLAL
ncbi:membrane bound O-acyl transferase family-domain-containing protein [Phaeosphaeriaceae sp. PMI808]|nr:membrane bound O-acyl transferase family-domain-containing protein [Phaeosphaeriaceae sp. PMI808]